MSVSVDRTLRNRIMRFYKENPDEVLTADDMFVKFCYQKPRWILEDVLLELQDDGFLKYQGGMFYHDDPTPPPSRAPEKQKRRGAWYPTKPKAKEMFCAPEWIRENQPVPLWRYKQSEEKDVDKVRRFWERVEAKESCELWVDVSTGEKRITGLYEKQQDGWVPLLRSVRGGVAFAVNSYIFQVRKE